MAEKKSIVFGVTGSIAAYKAAELVRMMKRLDWDVRVIMTESALEFVGELTFETLSQHPVSIEMFSESESWDIEHVSLADSADVMLIAPCTANVIGKVANGLADDLLTATVLASKAPVVIAPAMNVGMWENVATRDNVALLKKRGVAIVDVGEGDLACGYEGKGRLADLDTIMSVVEGALRG